MHVLRLVLVGIAIGLAIILGVRFIGNPIGTIQTAVRREVAPPPAATSLTPEQARSAVEARLKTASEFMRFFKTVEAEFPNDYEKMIGNFSVRAQAGGVQSPDIYLVEILRSLRQSHGMLASRASVGMIERVFEYQAKIINTLAQSEPQLCADFLYGNAPQRFFLFSAKNRPLIAAMAEAGIEAILDGRSLAIDRASPSDEDFTNLEAELDKKGLGKPEIEALLDGKTPEPPLSDATMCRAGILYFETLRNLPQDSRLKIYALTIKLLTRG